MASCFHMDESSLRTRKTYDAIGARFIDNARDRTRVGPWLDRFAAGLSPGARVVDVGAGPGMDAVALRQRGLSAVGMDFSLGMLRSGLAEFPGARVQGDARRLPFASGGVSGVWANASLLHLGFADATLALLEAWRILRPGGLLHVALKHGTGSETETSRYGLPRFFQYWSGSELDAALAAGGFDVLDGALDAGPRGEWLVRLARRIG
jgi:SAM-dependent methyltransferase